MTVMEYNNSKNKILRETLHLDFDLIPTSQNVEIELNQDQVDLMEAVSATESCVYCLAINVPSGSCAGCPMAEAGNKCSYDTDNTWSRYTGKSNTVTHTFENSPAHLPMKELIVKFKREYVGKEWYTCK